jgi:hypothetical protein
MKTASLVALILGLLTILVVGTQHPGQGAAPSPKESVAELRAELEKLKGHLPDQAAVMSHVGYHWSNLWFALDQQNWPLADFYLSETRSNLKWAVRVKPFRKIGDNVIDLGKIADALDSTQLAQMKEAIAKKDKARSVKLYDDALHGCYACHKASDKPYLRPRRPEAPEVRVINFDPKATTPE